MLTPSRQSGIGVFCVEACFKYDVVLVALLYCYAVLCKLDATALVDSACRHVTDTTNLQASAVQHSVCLLRHS